MWRGLQAAEHLLATSRAARWHMQPGAPRLCCCVQGGGCKGTGACAPPACCRICCCPGGGANTQQITKIFHQARLCPRGARTTLCGHLKPTLGKWGYGVGRGCGLSHGIRGAGSPAF